MTFCRLLCTVYFVASFYKGWRVECDEQEYRLIRYLMSNYDSAVRPSSNATFALRVEFSLSLHQIVDVDEDNQVLTTNCWLTQKWNDVHLRWNATDFGGISVVRIPSDQVWKPDIVLHNNADVQSTLMQTENSNVILHSSGNIVWLSRGLFKSVCNMNIDFFPFDIQTCVLKFASWTHDVLQIELAMDNNQNAVSDFHPNGEFEMDGFETKLQLEKFSCCDEPYHVLTYTVTLRRRPYFVIFSLLLPCFVINLVSVFAFYIPCCSGEKVTLSIGSLLSITFLLTVARESLPHSQTIPLISFYYGATLCLVAFAALFSVISLNIHHRGQRGTQVPSCIKTLVLGCLGKMLFISTAPQRTKNHKLNKLPDPSRESSKSGLDQIEHYTVSPRLRHRSETPVSPTGEPQTPSFHLPPKQVHVEEQQPFERRFLRVLHEVHDSLERNEHRVAHCDELNVAREDWEQVAHVCDRFLLFVFLLAAFLSAFLILYTAATH